jgi:hypothetical protein
MARLTVSKRAPRSERERKVMTRCTIDDVPNPPTPDTPFWDQIAEPYDDRVLEGIGATPARDELITPDVAQSVPDGPGPVLGVAGTLPVNRCEPGDIVGHLDARVHR